MMSANNNTKKGSIFYLIGVCFITTIGGFLFGFDTAIISGCNSFLGEHYQLDAAGLGWVASSALLGTIAGCIISGLLADRIGRKKTLIIAAFCLTVSAFGSMMPPAFLSIPSGLEWFKADLETSFNALIIARLIGGIGVGITAAVAPVYISELTLPENRGKMVSMYQLSITLGILLAFLVDWLILSNAGDAAGQIAVQTDVGFIDWAFKQEIWRGMFGTEIPIAILFFGLLFLTPESPRWLVANGYEEKAMKVLIRVAGEASARAEMHDIKENLKEEKGGIKELLAPHLRKPLMIGILLPMFSHLSGIAAIMYFAPNILNEAVQSVENAFLGAVLVGVVNSAFTFVAICLIDRYGRRKLLMVGVSGAMLSLAGVAILFAVGSKWVLIPLLFYIACFAFSYGPVVWTVIGEIFPTKVRGVAAAMGTLSLMITGFVITYTLPIMIEKISAAGAFSVYAALTVPALFFIWKFVPETKGKTLEEIEHSWVEQARNK